MPQKIRTNLKQRDVLERLLFLFGENGYAHMDVAKKFRRHRLDQLVVHKTKHSKFLIIRPTPTGLLSITLFTMSNQYDKLKNVTDSLKEPERKTLRWSTKHLRDDEERPDAWKEYFPDKKRSRINVASF